MGQFLADVLGAIATQTINKLDSVMRYSRIQSVNAAIANTRAKTNNTKVPPSRAR